MVTPILFQNCLFKYLYIVAGKWKFFGFKFFWIFFFLVCNGDQASRSTLNANGVTRYVVVNDEKNQSPYEIISCNKRLIIDRKTLRSNWFLTRIMSLWELSVKFCLWFIIFVTFKLNSFLSTFSLNAWSRQDKKNFNVRIIFRRIFFFWWSWALSQSWFTFEV